MGSSNAVPDGLSRIRSSSRDQRLLGGILSNADVSTSPVALLDYFIELGATHVDFLFPDFNHDTAPIDYRDGTLGRWMIQLF
jgi:hypothetical protein